MDQTTFLTKPVDKFPVFLDHHRLSKDQMLFIKEDKDVKLNQVIS